MDIRKDAEQIIRASIRQVLPDEAVARTLRDRSFGQGKVFVVAAGVDKERDCTPPGRSPDT